jgi:hypothetical protein
MSNIQKVLNFWFYFGVKKSFKEMSTSRVPKLGHGGKEQKVEQGNNNSKAP